MAHITGLDVVATTEMSQKKIRMILQLNPLKVVSLFPYRQLLNAICRTAYPTEVQKSFSKNAFSLLPEDQIINNNNKCSLRRKSHTPIYSFWCFTLKEALIFFIHQSASSSFPCWCVNLLPLDTWDINIILCNNQQKK